MERSYCRTLRLTRVEMLKFGFLETGTSVPTHSYSGSWSEAESTLLLHFGSEDPVQNTVRTHVTKRCKTIWEEVGIRLLTGLLHSYTLISQHLILKKTHRHTAEKLYSGTNCFLERTLEITTTSGLALKHAAGWINTSRSMHFSS